MKDESAEPFRLNRPKTPASPQNCHSVQADGRIALWRRVGNHEPQPAALYQGTILIVPNKSKKISGLQPLREVFPEGDGGFNPRIQPM
jgi:hypothetical protein